MNSQTEIQNSDKPYGYYAPSAKQSRIIALTRTLPNSWIGKRLGYTLRKFVKSKDGNPFDIDVFGMMMRLFPYDNKCEKRVLCLPQLFDLEERQAIKTFIEEQKLASITFLDLGANIGLYSLYVQSILRDMDGKGAQSKIVAVEADPYIYERLQSNVSLNDGFIHTVPAALSDKDGHIDLHINTHNRGENSILSAVTVNDNNDQSVGHASTSTVNVKSIKLSTLMDDYDITAPDIVKLDLEGAEDIVLGSFFKYVEAERYPVMILIEYEKKRDQSMSDLLQSHGYVLKSRTKNNCIFVRSSKS